MLHGNSNIGYGMIEAKPQQECKPDFEQMISSARKRLGKVLALKNSIFDYVGVQTITGPLAEMVGELVAEERVLDRRIDELITAQEQ